MRNTIILLVMTQFIFCAFSENFNFSGWSKEKNGIKVCAFTEKKEYQTGEKLKLFVRIMNNSNNADFNVKYVLLYKNDKVFIAELAKGKYNYSFSLFDNHGIKLPYNKTSESRFTHPFTDELCGAPFGRHRPPDDTSIQPRTYQDFVVTEDILEYIDAPESGQYELTTDIFLPWRDEEDEDNIKAFALFRTPRLCVFLKAVSKETSQLDNNSSDAVEDIVGKRQLLQMPVLIKEDSVYGIVIDNITMSRREISKKNERSERIIEIGVRLKNTGDSAVAVEDFGMFDTALWRKFVRRMQYPDILKENSWPLYELFPSPPILSIEETNKLMQEKKNLPDYLVIKPGELKTLKLYVNEAITSAINDFLWGKIEEGLKDGDTYEYSMDDTWELSLSRKIFPASNINDNGQLLDETNFKWLKLPPIHIILKDYGTHKYTKRSNKVIKLKKEDSSSK